MLVLPYLVLPSDKPFWVRRETFLSVFDQEDFKCREELDIEQAYLSDWFHPQEEGVDVYFTIPAVSIVSGRTQFINGRHRTAVLLNHLDEIPIAFDTRELKSDAQDFIDRIPKRPLLLSDPIALPDLPIYIALPKRASS